MPSTNNSLACYREGLQVVIDAPHYSIRIYQFISETCINSSCRLVVVVITGISALMETINPVFIKLQAQSLLISAQAALLSDLTMEISAMIGIQGPVSDKELVNVTSTGAFNVANGR